MRVVNLLFDDRYGGPQKRVLEVARELADVGIETIMCLPHGDGNAAEIARDAGVPVRRVRMERVPNPRQFLRVARWGLLFPRDVAEYLRVLRELRPDVAHVNGAFFLAPAVAARLAGVPLVWHLNDTLVPKGGARLLGAIVRRLADRVVVAAEAVASHYQVSDTQHEVLYAPVDVSVFQAGDGAPAGEFRVGLLANWNPLKGIDDFVRAGSLARRELGDKLRLILAGARLATHPEYAARIDVLVEEAELQPILQELGFVRDVGDLLRTLDVVALSSTSEACPIAVLEGMAAGLPVVATDVGGVRELLLGDPDRPAGIVVPPRDPVALAAAIVQLARDPRLRAALGKSGRQRAERLFSLERCADRHARLYEELKSSRRSRAGRRLAGPSDAMTAGANDR